jgi:hypothetical protein
MNFDQWLLEIRALIIERDGGKNTGPSLDRKFWYEYYTTGMAPGEAVYSVLDSPTE